ncbi:MAG: molybdopterin-dependent oxidoreductase, partial [Rhodospirillales bacterium]|nr:molybdopterin-dependent oxidoreductase [Rhodospirillales bacterium]
MDELSETARSTGDNSVKTTFSTCYMCTSDCPITVESQGDDIINISHPDCIRATAMLEQRESPERVLGARIRGAAGEPWQGAAWDGAVQYAADKMLEIREAHGAEAVAFFVGYTKEARPYLRRLQTEFGSPHYITESSCCFGATYIASTLTFGEDYNHFFQASRFRQEETKCRIVWSNNPKDSLIPYERHYLLAEADKVPTIAVDPRRTSMAEAAKIHLQPRPGTDGALALGMAHIILEEGLEDAEFLDAHAHGFEDYRDYVKGFTPEHTREITWVPENLIIDAARLYGHARPAQITVSQEALVQHRNGLQNHRAVMLLAALTGNLDVRGGNRPWTTRLKQQGVAVAGGTKKPAGMAMGGDRYPVFPEIYNDGQALLLAEYIE